MHFFHLHLATQSFAFPAHQFSHPGVVALAAAVVVSVVIGSVVCDGLLKLIWCT
jgi:hypothetical protein